MDEIRVNGIYSMGYGQVAKVVMQDPEISIIAKAIYSYFCSHTGSGVNTCFPSVSTILTNLDLNETTYYRQLKVLTNYGLISVDKNIKKGVKGFIKNVYTIVDCPETYIQDLKQRKTKSEVMELTIRAHSISSAGYGNVPRMMMIDNRLPVYAKGIYSYCCAYAGASHYAIPTKDTTLYQLGISSATYNRCTMSLESYGYITRSRPRVNGKMSKTMISINREFPEGCTPPHVLESRTLESHTLEAHALESHALESRTLDCAANNPRRKPKKASKQTENPSILAPACAPAPARVGEPVRAEDGAIDRGAILVEMADYGGLPYDYCYNRPKLEAAIALLTGGEVDLQNASQAERQLYKLFVSALAEMLDANAPDTSIRKATLSVIKIYKEFVRTIEAGYDDYGAPYAVAPQLYIGTRHRYIQATAKNPPDKNRLNYMKAVIWTELTTAELEIQEQIALDFADEGD